MSCSKCTFCMALLVTFTISLARPQNNEHTQETTDTVISESKRQLGNDFQNDLKNVDNSEDLAYEIQKKINEINAKLKKPPPKKYYYKFEDEPLPAPSFDEFTFHQYLDNYFSSLKKTRSANSKALRYPTDQVIIPYEDFVNEKIKENEFQAPPLTKLGLPISWPFAHLFPILIKDPFLAVLHGGGVDNLVEYGQQADVCSKDHLSDEPVDMDQNNEPLEDDFYETNILHLPNRLARKLSSISKSKTHKSKSIKKKTSKLTSSLLKPLPVKVEAQTEEAGDLRFPFGNSEFGWFGQKKPVAPSPGFFINRLKVRRGGVAIAGPGGVATAGRGGTAIVGPGGMAYTQPGGMAIAGPAAKVVAVPAGENLNEFIHNLHNHNHHNNDPDYDTINEENRKIPKGARIVATGPAVYYHNDEDIQ